MLFLGLSCFTSNSYAFSTQPLEAVPFISEKSANMIFSNSESHYLVSPVGTDYSVNFNVNISSPSYVGFGFSIPDSSAMSVFSYPFNFAEFDYWVAWSLWSESGATDIVNFVPNSMRLSYMIEGQNVDYVCSDFSFRHMDGAKMQGFTAIGRFTGDYPSSTIRLVSCRGSGSINGNIYCRAFIYQVPKSDEGTLAGVQEAIYDQTSQLMQGSGGEELTPGLVQDIENKVNEKMGVLSFGETVLSRFVNLWTVTGSTELTLPGFSMEVEGVIYDVWTDKKYNLTVLESQFPALITAVRTVLVLLVWLRLLNYIIREFERFFDNG